MRWSLLLPHGASAQDAAFLQRRLFWLPVRRGGEWRKLRACLNKVQMPDPDNFHTHPATAIRIILKGGYVEVERRDDGREVEHVRGPGNVSLVRPQFCHRIARLLDGPSWSLWLRGPITHDVVYLERGGRAKRRTYASSARRRRD